MHFFFFFKGALVSVVVEPACKGFHTGTDVGRRGESFFSFYKVSL